MLKRRRKMNRRWRAYSKFHYRRVRLWLKLNEEGIKAEESGDMERAIALILATKKATREIRMSC